MPKLREELAACKHPKSRKTAALAKKTRKDKRKEQIKLGRYVKQNLVGEKLVWFKNNLPDADSPSYGKDRILPLIRGYLSRFDEELEQIRLKNSVGGRRNRQHASREDAIAATKTRELDEFDGCGIEIPDLTDPNQVRFLRSWNEEFRFLPKFEMKRFGPRT